MIPEGFIDVCFSCSGPIRLSILTEICCHGQLLSQSLILVVPFKQFIYSTFLFICFVRICLVKDVLI